MAEENENWLESLPEPLREAPFIGKAASLDDAVGKLAHAAQLLGTSVRIPGEDAKPEDVEAFFEKAASVPGLTRLPSPEDTEGLAAVLAKLGAPGDAKEYELPEVSDFEWGDEVSSALRESAQKAGLTKAQFKQLAEAIGENERNAAVTANSQAQQEQEALKQEWGAAYDERVNEVTRWLDGSSAPAELREQAAAGGLTAATMNWLHDTAAQFKGDKAPAGSDGKGGESTLTPAQAKHEIQNVLANEAYFNPADPRHGDLKKKMVELHRLANGA